MDVGPRQRCQSTVAGAQEEAGRPRHRGSSAAKPLLNKGPCVETLGRQAVNLDITNTSLVHKPCTYISRGHGPWIILTHLRDTDVFLSEYELFCKSPRARLQPHHNSTMQCRLLVYIIIILIYLPHFTSSVFCYIKQHNELESYRNMWQKKQFKHIYFE